MTKDEALRLALEALESTGENDGYHGVTQYFDERIVDEAITAIKAALEAKDEPDYKALWQQMCERCDELDKKLAQRTWLGLSDEEKKSFWTADQMTQEEWDELFSAIEAKLKQKNFKE